MNTLEAYLQSCRRRLRARFIARGSATIVIGGIALTALSALLFITLVPAGGWVMAARIFLYLSLVAAIAILFRWPFKPSAVASEVEQRAHEFGGRLSTWHDATTRGDHSPMLTLLTKETQTIAATRAPEWLIKGQEIIVPAGIATLLAIALIAFLAAPTSPWQLAAQRLWTGDLFTAAAPRITVNPGDVVVPRGTDVVVNAVATGFSPRSMELHAAFEQADGWETAPMSRLGSGKYGFVFVGVTEEVAYYVGAQGLNSERHVIHVADLPKVIGVDLTYTYPDWTGLATRVRADGDVAALPGTEVQISATTDLPVEDPLLVVNGEAIAATADGFTAEGSFAVSEPGTWHIAVRHEGTLARISDSYFIDVVEDKPPEVMFGFPGHDVQATPIEEVTVRFNATDDFGIDSLSFNYSVNGGAWVEVPLDIEAAAAEAGASESALSAFSEITAEHLLYLENLSVPDPLQDPVDSRARSLKPGDMITFWAEVKDHTLNARTALYFIDVRPFDRVYRESDTAAGQGQGGGGLEIVDRQREILSATWNLINDADYEKIETGDRERKVTVDDQSEVLALLQRTLKDQVTTLIERANARRLTMDDEIDTFTSELTLASEDMEPAAERLEAKALADAIAPEQQALQHLLAANATMSDVDVSLDQPDQRGTAGQSLSELMDLEMDPERNRYESQQQPSVNQETQQEDEEWQRLEALAARQEQLAEQQRRGEESLASRWQQERLQRELEELREQLERRQQNQQAGNRSQQAMENAIAELNDARQAIDESLQQSAGDPSATREASRALQRAAEQLRENAIGNMDERLARTSRQVENLLSDQRNIMDMLDDIQRDAIDASNERRAPRYDDFAMEPYAERKRRMQQDLNEVTRDIGEVGEAVDDGETRELLERALIELSQERVDERLAASAEAFEYGQPLYAIGNEASVERALMQLSRRVEQARQRLGESDPQGQGAESALAQVRTLRQALANAAPANDSGAGGGYDGDQVNGVLRAADALEFRLEQEFGEGFEIDTSQSRARYAPRGIDSANDEALVQMTRDRLDLIEATLLNREAAPIRAQEPRDDGRDSEAAARYFRDLSRPEG